jgi:WYL_2, Sm-like SH3 beta-barrel fold
MSYIDINPQAFVADLQQAVVEIIFDKIDGTRRQMRCTLMKNMLPPGTKDAPKHIKEGHNQVLGGGLTITVWDVDVGDWRSFRGDRVISCQMLNWG